MSIYDTDGEQIGDIVTRCLACGADETDEPGVEVTREEPQPRNPRRSLLEQVRETYECQECGASDTVNTGVEGESESDLFGVTTAPLGEEMLVRIDGTGIQYRHIEEYVNETTLYDRTGLTTNGRTHHVIIMAFRPPTLTKGNAHRVDIGGHLDKDMMLVGIRYFTSDDPWRRLHFVRGLSGGPINKAQSTSPGETE